jgi:glutamyl-tRNA reductase
VFGNLSQRAVLLVGAGEMAELVARHLRTAGVENMAIANRTASRAEALAQAVGAQLRPLEDDGASLVWADLVVCSAASPRPLFTRENVGAALKARKHRPLFMVDLAVPRDVDPEVGKLPGVYAYDVDDIQKVVSENAAARAAEAAKAEVIIAEEVARFERARAIRDGVPVLALLRQQAERIARAEAERTLAHLGEGLTEKQRKSVEAMATAIVNKLLHQPTAKLRSTSGEEDSRLASAAAELFGLEDEADLSNVAGGTKR